MSDLICRKTMMRCPTPGTCSPHGGCQSQHDRDSSELRRLCAERDTLRTANQRLEGEVKRLRESLIEVTASLEWNAHGICRGVTEGPIMPSAMAVAFAKAALSTANSEVTE